MKPYVGSTRREDVDPAAAAGLRESHQTGIIQHGAQLVCGACGVGKIGPRLRIEVNAQLVDLLGVRLGHRPGVVAECAEIRHPGDRRQFGRAHLIRGSARREGDRHGLDPVGHALGRRPLLIERLTMMVASGAELDVRPVAARPTLHGDRSVLERGEDAVPHGNHVGHDVELGQPDLREIDLVGAGHPYGAVTHLELDRWHRHWVSIGEYCREQADRAGGCYRCPPTDRQT